VPSVSAGYTKDMSTRDGDILPSKPTIPHYYGDSVRIIFVLSAVIILVAQSMGIIASFSTFIAVLASALLVIAAGITNPTQMWIHWLNALLALAGTLFFGTVSLEHYRLGTELLNLSFIANELLAILSLIALYLSTKTLRGFYLNVF
jgi:hypothetical protein